VCIKTFCMHTICRGDKPLYQKTVCGNANLVLLNLSLFCKNYQHFHLCDLSHSDLNSLKLHTFLD
jgi:hypothetical protein